MKKIILFLLLIFVSCTSNTIYKKPKNLIPKDTMKALLKDMYIASSTQYIVGIQRDKEVDYMPLIYEKYKIDTTRFENSNTYYTSRVEEYNEMIKEIKVQLDLELKAIEKQIKIKDSLSQTKIKSVK